MIGVHLVEDSCGLGFVVIEAQCTKKRGKLIAVDVARVVHIEDLKGLLEDFHLLWGQLLLLSFIFFLIR